MGYRIASIRIYSMVGLFPILEGYTLIDIKKLKLAFGEKIIFDSIDWQIPDRGRIGLVGDNGSGKTTLMRVLVGEHEADDGIIDRSKNLNVGYLPQDLVELEDISILDYLKQRSGLSMIEDALRSTELALSNADPNSQALAALLAEHSRLERNFEQKNGFAFEPTARKVLRGLGFAYEDAERSCLEFSGGWKMRVALAALLLSHYDVLLLDEPTNHLDTESMEWLEGWLSDFRGAIIAVSHDRRFLDNMTEQIVELHKGKLTLYPWGYERYLVEREIARERTEKTVLEQKAKVQEIERFVSRFRYKASKASQVQSRLKLLEKMDVQEADVSAKTVRFMIPEAHESGWEVLGARDVSKSYGKSEIFSSVDFSIHRGERVALVGVNGAGKSTLLRLLSDVEAPSEGTIRLGHNVKRAFYSQESAQNVNYSRTIWEEIKETSSKLNEVGKRTLLGSFLFSGEDIHKSVSILSGGEKARLALCKLMLSESNFLILDEPTNHLDLKTKELFQQALLCYRGTLLIVSHDRHFLDDLVDRVLEIRDGQLFDYPGNYSWFLEKRQEALKGQEVKTVKTSELQAVENSSKEGQTYRSREQKRLEAEERDRRARAKKVYKKELDPLEARIALSEKRREEIDAALCLSEVLSDSAQVQELMKERKELERMLNEDFSRWEELSLLMEEVQ